MKTLHYSIIIMAGVILSLAFFHAPTASAHLIPSFSVQPDQNYTDPVTHYLNTKKGHPHIVITRDSEFTLPMTLKSENDSRTTSYLIHVTDGNNFTAETMPPGVSIRVVPDHFITSNGTDQKFNIVIKVDKNAPSGVYEPNLVIKWSDNVTQSREISSISFQVGKWNWDSLSKQMDTGISAENVICKSSDHIVVIKSEDGSPACVKPETKIQLLKIGWAKPGPKDFGYNPGRGPLVFHDPQSNGVKPHGLPTTPDIRILYNGTQSYQGIPFYVKQGQNVTLMVDVTSDPVNIPVTLYVEPHIGFTKTNGIDLKLSDTVVNTPAKIILYMSISKDATPNTYQTLVKANTTGMGLDSHFFVAVK